MQLYNCTLVQFDVHSKRRYSSFDSFDASYRIQLTCAFTSECHLQSSGGEFLISSTDFAVPRTSEDFM